MGIGFRTQGGQQRPQWNSKDFSWETKALPSRNTCDTQIVQLTDVLWNWDNKGDSPAHKEK
jgi:hypothetical protein